MTYGFLRFHNYVINRIIDGKLEPGKLIFHAQTILRLFSSWHVDLENGRMMRE